MWFIEGAIEELCLNSFSKEEGWFLLKDEKNQILRRLNSFSKEEGWFWSWTRQAREGDLVLIPFLKKKGDSEKQQEEQWQEQS